MNTIKIIIYFFTLLCLNIPVQLRADNPQEMLVGHHEKEEKLITKVQAIVTGQFLSLGDGPGMDSGGMEYYDNAQVKVQTSLKGPLSGTITVSYSVQSVKEKESHPQASKDYIFFIKIISPTQLSAVKLVPASDDKIAQIKTLIATEPATK